MHKQACECEEVSSLPVTGPLHAEVISCDKLHELKTPNTEKKQEVALETATTGNW